MTTLIAVLKTILAGDDETPDNVESLDYIRKLKNKGLQGKYSYQIQLRLCSAATSTLTKLNKEFKKLKEFLDVEAPDVDKQEVFRKIEGVTKEIESIKTLLGNLK